MINRIFGAALVFLAVSAVPSTAGENEWVGLYKGLDALDGSVDYLSISTTAPGEFEIRIVPSVISLCETGVGWIVATGRLVEEGTLLRENARVFCQGAEPVSLENRYFVRDDETGVIRYGASDDGRSLIYHRISDD
ncbi:hypothetical protein [Hoeflea prorocentri]|uniref:Uncharacterized protein n=1 Tax=Hoeflea prorocentri TaxID=1922333 RepID=A0A9X3ULE4_9HYPH|nr:hypothetical protein [Hoeflea prorocentri]MCY6382565.1 hypothetical protein [Hoeflea prorocentri]MDA5400365.1 hypothetical protein [Hoeflea prorocentri]